MKKVVALLLVLTMLAPLDALSNEVKAEKAKKGVRAGLTVVGAIVGGIGAAAASGAIYNKVSPRRDCDDPSPGPCDPGHFFASVGIGLLSFTAGAAVGGLVTHHLTRPKKKKVTISPYLDLNRKRQVEGAGASVKFTF